MYSSFYELFYLYPWLSLVQTAFLIWMLVDAYRRPAETFWFFVILFLQPIGPWIYFFVIKIHDFHGVQGLQLPFLNRRPSLDELRYQAEHVPTLASQLALAERLVEMNDHAGALPYLESALQREPEHCQILFLQAVCYAELGQPDKAVPNLERVIARDRAWSDYSAWRLLISARTALKDTAGALNNCRDLARIAPTLRHRCLLAEHLIEDGQAAEARELLERALEDHQYAPSITRRRNRTWASQAKRLLKQAATTKV
jgi:hypothetical protein